MIAPVNRETAGGGYKWYVLGLLVLIYIMGTVDRAVLSVIAEPLKLQFQLSDKQLGVLTGTAYSVTYALAVLPMGWLIDRVDRRALLSVTITIWSLLTAATGFAQNYAQQERVEVHQMLVDMASERVRLTLAAPEGLRDRSVGRFAVRHARTRAQ